MSFLDERFTSKYDDNPKLKGKQKDLPDALQKSIVGKTNEGVAKDLEMKAMEASSLEEFLDDVYQDYPQHKGKWEIEDFLKKYYLNAGGPIDEGKVKNFLTGLALFTALMAGKNAVVNSDPGLKKLKVAYEQAEKKDDTAKMKELKDKITKQKIWLEAGEGEPQSVDEAKKTVELPADTTFTVDLKHLMKKHMDEGKSKEDTIKLTKTLMAKLHDKGKVTVKGTKVMFKEDKKHADDQLKFKKGDTVYFKNVKGGEKLPMTITGPGKFRDSNRLDAGGKEVVFPVKGGPGGKGMYAADDLVKEGKKKSGYTEFAEADIPQDTQLALPEPDAPDYLGDDGMDYEGGMAKSQMLKMKKYAMALCDMVDDETQLEAWVQAKITKASDYMSSVYHYLDYQKSKMDEGKFDDPGHEKMNRDRAAQLADKEEEFKPLTKQEKDSLVKNGKLKKSELAAYEKFLKDNPDLPDSLSAALKAFKNKK